VSHSTETAREPAGQSEPPIIVRLYPGPIRDAVVRLAREGNRPYQRQVDLIMEKGLEVLGAPRERPRE